MADWLLADFVKVIVAVPGLDCPCAAASAHCSTFAHLTLLTCTCRTLLRFKSCALETMTPQRMWWC